ncbi:MAG: hypothetical protein Q8N35_10635 [Methylococcaceae bacterium]|jgi:hypothetical protein|nr:hypothetical protein [Methylococcaceae bacterium]MDZ4157041.1 hypothetical protein [Methylococcales bacterium]MDP2394206.1 hypothetical protein [Methylococcaceae bacterium]MDP3020034.1 hypothetical protein [Methylococcaceae bacterium]MDP3388776.1 hypothetical protein [Methylococcaceae bacterium]
MADEQNTNQSPETENAGSNGLTASLLALKESNPKVFFGAIGGIFILVAIVLFSGGGSNPIPSAAPKNLVIGQKYTLKNPNAYEVASPIRLVTVPGAIAAYDDSEDETKKEACRQIQQGSAVLLTELQDAYGKKNVFSKVKIEDGECKGSEGWVLSIDVQ